MTGVQTCALPISVAKLEQAVITELRRFTSEYLDRDELEENVEFQNNWMAEKKRLEKDIAVYQKKVEEYARCIRELYLDKAKGILSEYEYLDFSRSFSAEKERFETLAAEAEKQLTAVMDKMQFKSNCRQRIEQYTNFEKLDREIVDSFVERIFVGRRIPGTWDVPVEIHWNF